MSYIQLAVIVSGLMGLFCGIVIGLNFVILLDKYYVHKARKANGR
jgi:hypothetical protein